MVLARLKRNSVFRFFYSIPWLVSYYHFLLAFFAAPLYRYPSKKLYVIGVTGTKGKTTTLELLNAILEAAGKKTALLSSLRIKVGEKSEKNMLGNTMPGRFYIQGFLARAAAAGCKYALVEATSQGALMSRHRFINWNAAILTNLAPEHIEAHGTFENYRAAKLSFLQYVAEGGGKIFLNRDDASFDFFSKSLKNYQPIAYSRNDEESRRIFPSYLRSAISEAQPFLFSDFNKANMAGAVALANELGIGEKTIEEALRHFKGVPGRMEFVQRKPFAVVVDYAHTPDSLDAAYRVLKNSIKDQEPKFADSKLICVLGAAGGGRDKWKRPAMGRVAAGYCDKIILTNEDPYDENPDEIVEQISSGFSRAPGGYYHLQDFEKILDRRSAIEKAISLARPGDVVIMTGKGSEDWIHIEKGRKISWNEKAVAEGVLGELQES